MYILCTLFLGILKVWKGLDLEGSVWFFIGNYLSNNIFITNTCLNIPLEY
jgi:hypothetical protein